MLDHFQYEQLVQAGYVLTDQQEEELKEVLEQFIEAQLSAAPESDMKELATELAALAFMAGRSFQHDEEFMAAGPNAPEEGVITLKLSPQTASKLLERLLG